VILMAWLVDEEGSQLSSERVRWENDEPRSFQLTGRFSSHRCVLLPRRKHEEPIDWQRGESSS